MQQRGFFLRLIGMSDKYVIFDSYTNLIQIPSMKKLTFLFSVVMLSVILLASCDRKSQDQVPLFFKEVIYDFSDGVDYFTANLLTCNGVKDVNDPSKGTIYATISIKANRNCYLKFKSIDGLISDTYITEFQVYPLVYHTSKPFVHELSMATNQVTVLNLEFPDVPARLLKVGRLRVAVDINNYKTYAFTVYQIPFKPDTDVIIWN